MSGRRSLALLTFLTTLAVPALAHAQGVFRFPEAKKGKADLKYHDGLPVLVVSGSPEDIGAGVGKLALAPASRVVDYPHDLLRWIGLERTWGVFLGTGRGMYRQFPPEYRRELEAIAAAAGVERDALIAGNTFFDIKKILACSCVLLEPGRSSTGGPILARNLDYPSLGYIHYYSLVTVYRPAGKHAFVSVGFPGLVGVVSGMNDAGLTVAVLEVFDTREPQSFDARGVPYGLCLRKVLEDCSTIAEAKRKLEGFRRTTTLNIAVADRTGVAVLEITPRSVLLRGPERGVGVACNHFCSPSLKPDRPMNIDRSFQRFAKLEEVRGWRGKVTPEELRKQLDACNLGSLTLQTMAFEPATLRLHLSVGKSPASAQPFRVLDLAPLLRPAAPARAAAAR